MVNNEFVQMIQVISSIVTPIVILLLGLKLNKTLEANKASLAKDKEWRTEWGKRFYSSAIEFNAAVDDGVLLIFFVSEISREKLPGWEERIKQKQNSVYTSFERLQRAEWTLKTTVEFAPQSKDDVISSSHKIWMALSELWKNKQGNIDTIRSYLFDFNKAAMKAHREILGK